jgi:hypothetical protein
MSSAITSGSATARRPQRNASRFIVTASPLSAMAFSIAAAVSGTRPSW